MFSKKCRQVKTGGLLRKGIKGCYFSAQVFVGSCSEDLDYQISQSVLSTHWDIPDSYKPFITDIYWKIQERAPFAGILAPLIILDIQTENLLRVLDK